MLGEMAGQDQATDAALEREAKANDLFKGGDDDFGPAWELGNACKVCYEAAVKLKSRINASDDAASFEYGITAGKAFHLTSLDFEAGLKIAKLIFDHVMKS